MKATDARIRSAMERPAADIRLYLLHGPDEAGAAALQKRLEAAMGAEAERVDLDGATLKGDPARLADEAASLSLFGGARHIRVTGMGEESLEAVAALLASDRAGNPVVAIAPSVKATGKLVKLAIESNAALAFACYAPSGQAADRVAGEIAGELGLRLGGATARRVVQAAGGDRSVMARELEKIALYLDAAPDRPREVDAATLDAIGADLSEAEIGAAVEAVIAGEPAILALELARLGEGGASPIPWLRGLARRLAALAEMRAEVDGGDSPETVVKRHRVFFKEEESTKAALRRWPAKALAEAQARVRMAERAVVAPGNAGTVLAEHDALTLARRIARRR